ncbi:hypothetical protein ENBRE01_0369 [Enteropsectra breve]|nr:hypothetical protein ENBRE01_0369 [Enteropsectra breve]
MNTGDKILNIPQTKINKIVDPNSTDHKYIEMSTRNGQKAVSIPVGSQKVLVFDIDDCLYTHPEMNTNFCTMLKEKFLERANLPETQWAEHNKQFGLFRELFFRKFNMHPSEFDALYELPSLNFALARDELLIEMLSKIKHRMFCFTNGSKERAKKLLKTLGIEHFFECVFCADTVDTEFISKPSLDSFTFVEKVLGIKGSKNIHFFDDSERNIDGARAAGWSAYLVKEDIKDHLEGHLEAMVEAALEVEASAKGTKNIINKSTSTKNITNKNTSTKSSANKSSANKNINTVINKLSKKVKEDKSHVIGKTKTKKKLKKISKKMEKIAPSLQNNTK